MPFCVNCGREYTEGQKFCNSCGAPLGTAVSISQQVQPQPISPYAVDNSVQSVFNERNSHIEEMTKMCDHFLPYKDKYDRYFFLLNRLKASNGYIVAIVFGFIFVNIASIIASSTILPAINLMNDWSGASEIEYIKFFSGLSWSIIFYIIGIPLIIVFICGTVSRSKKRKKMKAESEEILDELWNHYISYGPCLLGFEYTIPENLNEIRDLLVSGRANNIRDAVNTMLDDKHKRQMEALATATAKYAQQAARNTAITAAAVILK